MRTNRGAMTVRVVSLRSHDAACHWHPGQRSVWYFENCTSRGRRSVHPDFRDIVADLDVWIDPSAENVARVWEALLAFGAPMESLGITQADLLQPDIVAQFGLPPYRIDFLTGVSGVVFAEAWPTRVEAQFGDVAAPFIGREEFIRNKRASGRTRDLADLEALGEA